MQSRQRGSTRPFPSTKTTPTIHPIGKIIIKVDTDTHPFDSDRVYEFLGELKTSLPRLHSQGMEFTCPEEVEPGCDSW